MTQNSVLRTWLALLCWLLGWSYIVTWLYISSISWCLSNIYFAPRPILWTLASILPPPHLHLNIQLPSQIALVLHTTPDFPVQLGSCIVLPISTNGTSVYSVAQAPKLWALSDCLFFSYSHSMQSKSCWSRLQNLCYTQAVIATSSMTNLIQTMIVFHVSVAIAF